MIPNITRGGDAPGLIAYLFGEGRHSEHTDQHIIAGSPELAAPELYGGRELDREEVLLVGRLLDLNRLEHSTEVMGKCTHWDNEQGEIVSDGVGQSHVWHCSLTLHPDEEALSDERWAQIVTDFMDEMGMTEASGHPPARWIAVRHGLHANGADHVHIAAVLVREDGRKVDVWRDYSRCQRACNMLEHKYGLAVVEGRERRYERNEALR